MKHDKPFVYKGREYYGFEPGVWTNIVSFAFWEQYLMNGRCKNRSCLNSVRGIIKDLPSDEGPVVITMKCQDTRFHKHADVKRSLIGEKRKEVQKKLLRFGVLGWKKEEARNILKPGDIGSPFLYNSSTLHQAKKEITDKELGIHPDDRRDLILAIRKMNQDPLYMNSISWISDTPFFVFYATPTQFHTYTEYQPMMIDCEELSRLKEIVMMTLIVCSTQFQDSIIAIGDRMITPEKARENLEELVARRNPDLTVIDTLEIDPDKTMIFEKLSSQATNDKGWPVY
ncbi:hypothetical protein PV325_012379 [Microctonus aethiopoides]|nr:hypothetical protein PV325_012379 [Microctonus aethiopoides]